jgi:hypothetical protein
MIDAWPARPDHWQTSWIGLVRALPVLVPSVGPWLPRALTGLAMMERSHPRERDPR